jgi:23S rRNA (cytidine1920-2'-O)/16S rRNA (cytidine1409-2'-O)-methyltransferase
LSKKVRLDLLVQTKLPGVSRTQVVNLIAQGQVSVNGLVVTKRSQQVLSSSEIVCKASAPKYVSRAGLKLEYALEKFKIDVIGKIALDAGLSTGGFTDCLLQHGASKVYGVDVGTNQAHPKISSDQRVCVLEQTNLRYLEKLPELVDLVTLDLSFISLLKVISNIIKFLKPAGLLVVLIKPQFEVGPENIGTGGIVKNTKARNLAVQNVLAGIKQAGFTLIGLIDSPILGGDGNCEYLAYFCQKQI